MSPLIAPARVSSLRSRLPPVSFSLSLAAAGADAARRALQLGGGDDYELCFTASPNQRDPIARSLAASGTPAKVIGRIQAEPGVRVRLADGAAWTPPRRGYQHFA